MPTWPCYDAPVESADQDQGTNTKFGRGWEFATAPRAPRQRIFTLKLVGMRWYYTSPGVPDLTTSPARNVGTLSKFYGDNGMHTPFTFVHPHFGSMTVRFYEPLSIPAVLSGGGGHVGEITVKLLELPT